MMPTTLLMLLYLVQQKHFEVLALWKPVTPQQRQMPACPYPAYARFEDRLRSFDQYWPHDQDIQRLTAMANCGFFFTGNSDCVRCFQCGIGLKDWSKEDDPLVEHHRHSPSCLYLEDTVHPDKLKSYDDVARIMLQLQKGNKQKSTQKEHRYRNPEYSTEQARRTTFAHWPSNLTQTPDALVQAGFYYTGFLDRVRCYCCDGGLQHWDRGDDPWVEHARWFPHCEHVKILKGEDYVRMVQLALQFADEGEEEASPNDVELEPTMNVSTAEGVAEGVAEENRDLLNRMTCILCEEHDTNVLFLPCAHHVMCGDCAADVTMCPICLDTVNRKVKTYRR